MFGGKYRSQRNHVNVNFALTPNAWCEVCCAVYCLNLRWEWRTPPLNPKILTRELSFLMPRFDLLKTEQNSQILVTNIFICIAVKKYHGVMASPEPMKTEMTDTQFSNGSFLALDRVQQNQSQRQTTLYGYPTDPFQKSHNASDKYARVHHFITEMCIFLLQNGAFWDI